MSLNSYPIIRKIGEGGFGTTYLATNTLMPSHPYCVVKKLIPTATDPQTQQLIQSRFKQEAITLENLGKESNGTIPSLYAYFVDRGEYYLVQEYVDGQTLGERLQTQGLFTEAQVRQLLTDLLPILSYVHQRGIVHRDIKPENIMVRQRDNKPMLIDFGAVKETMGTIMTPSGHTGKSIVIGTPGFMPVEQMSGRPMFASDIYALGLTIIYLLTRMMPTEFETDPHTGNLNWQSFAPNISPQLAAILDKAIQPVSNYRYQNAQDMLHALTNSTPTQAQIGQPATPAKTLVVPTPIDAPTQLLSPAQQDRDRSTNVQTGMNDRNNPMVATIVGVIIGGGLIVGGLVLGKYFAGNNPTPTASNSPTPTASNNPTLMASDNPAPTPTNSPAPTPINTPAPTPINTPAPTPTNSPTSTPISSNISREAALNTVQQWLNYKRSLLAPPYNKQLGTDLLTGKAYRDNVDKSSEPCNGRPDDCLSSADWLQKNNAEYSFGVQRIDSVDRFESSGDSGTIFVTVTEYRTLHKSNGQKTQSGGTKQARYDLQFENGKVKITDYKILN
ncbi:protein kinase domain-containing protein [Chamaesiphon minutus]|uniref:non-specific serine/threonine protein kinase n=1 Tax=Chamaesiphon minutus (strain ATCC 27169 / PCC 6605) TaxID=1173020 RepID=K9U9Z6_CHAP6|nr:IMS domain-containing protein [Chamaesiphon minutus]AFY91655.1 protein kinase family protein [Chamaesiphon minutus PCC 6605]